MTEVDSSVAKRPKSASILSTFKAVAWSFFGVRRSKDHADDMANLNPVHVVIAGLILAALFVMTLLFIVRTVVA